MHAHATADIESIAIDAPHAVGALVGLRMTADEFLALPDDGDRYELVDGVVIMSPSPTPVHQRVALEIASQLKWFLRQQPAGEAFMELDVRIGKSASGKDLVYRPDVLFIRAERMRSMPADCIVGPPDLVVEVLSERSRRMDLATKRDDYERLGVREYWVFDPAGKSMTFWRLREAAFAEIRPTGDAFASEAVPGFVLDLKSVRASFEL